MSTKTKHDGRIKVRAHPSRSKNWSKTFRQRYSGVQVKKAERH